MDGLRNVFARNCEVRRLDKPTVSAFLDSFHRLGYTTCRYRYGLVVKRCTGSGELALPSGTVVAVACFSNARRWLRDGRRISSYEWVRYASVEGVRVVGGMGKLLEAFVRDVSPDDIMSYADLSWPDGGRVYEKLGFVEECRVERAGHLNAKYRKVF